MLLFCSSVVESYSSVGQHQIQQKANPPSLESQKQSGIHAVCLALNLSSVKLNFGL